jgi:hypothetical protein
MNRREIVRTAVTKTNPFWPFSILNKTPYYLAIKACVLMSKGFPEIKSLYLRHGLLREDWIPGVSDIDLTVVIDSKLNVEEEFAFLRSFWTSYNRLKKAFPMLSDINIVNDEHAGSLTQFTILGYESIDWRLLYGKDVIRSNYLKSLARLKTDSLNHALLCYLSLFLKRFYVQEQPTCWAILEMQRLTSKILRYANYLDPNMGDNPGFCQSGENKTDMLCSIIQALEKSVTDSHSLRNSDNLVENATEWLIEVAPRDVFLKEQALELKELAPIQESLEAIYLSEVHKIVVMRDGLATPAIRACAEIATRSLRPMEPILVTRSIFDYMVKSYDPYLYTYLLAFRGVAYGDDVLADVPLPGMGFFIKSVLEQTARVLTFPQSREVILPQTPGWFSGPTFRSVVQRALFAKLYLEHRVIKPWHFELLEHCLEFYPRQCKEFDALREAAGYASASSLSERSFRLLKDLANDVHEGLADSSIVDELFPSGSSL